MKVFYKLLLTFNSTSTMIVVYLIKQNYALPLRMEQANWISFIIYLLFTLEITCIILRLKKRLSKDDINCEMRNVEEANNAFLPSYLGYFFIALSVNDNQTMIFVYFIVFIFTYFSQTLYFNPLFLLLGYKFYYITTINNVKLFVISRKEINSTNGLTFPKLRRINNTTFIDEEND